MDELFRSDPRSRCDARRLRAMALVALLSGALAVPAVASSASAPEGDTIVVSLQDIDCQSCGAAVTELLERQPGVRSARFDRDTAEVSVELGAVGPTGEEIVEVIQRAGYGAVVGAGKGRYLPEIEFPPDLDVAWISRAGEAVRIKDHLVPGKVTVVDFYAVWCGPCRQVDSTMREIVSESNDVALRKINVVDWSSPIARQELRNVEALPYVEVYGKSGRRVATVSGLDLERLRSAIEKARSR